MKIDEFLDKFKFKFNIALYCLIIFHIFYSTALLLRCEIYCESGICENRCNYSCFENTTYQ